MESEKSKPAYNSEVFQQVCTLADTAAKAQQILAQANTRARSELLNDLADALVEHSDEIAAANELDVRTAYESGMDKGRLDRLLFDQERVADSAHGVQRVAKLQDPVGEVIRGYQLDNGMRLNQIRVPMGLIGMIYEARPNVTVDVASLCLKSGNATLLRGGHDAQNTNAATVAVIGRVLEDHGFPPSLVSSVDRFGRAGAEAMMRARGHIDVLVPRGGSGLIASVVNNSTVPVIETGSGNVHIYVDSAADIVKAIPIVINAKTQRVGVCNTVEKLVVHRDIAPAFLPALASALAKARVTLRVDRAAFGIIDAQAIRGLDMSLADEQDWETEYLSLKIGIKIVDSLDSAINHINLYSTGHTEAIVSENYSAVEKFTRRIDSAVVMVNASTRFTDGGLFGFGAELGISTQKLHARGPMGLREMMTSKWVGYGTGQVRP